MKFTSAAVDVGFGQTKWAVRLEDEVITGAFPSLAPTSNDFELMGSDSQFSSPNTIRVVIDEIAYDVGPSADLAMSASNSGRSLSDEFPLSNNYRALLMGALYYAGVTHVDILTLGLPVNTMFKYANQLKDIPFDKYTVNGKTIHVGKVVVIPQPVGSLAMFAATNNTIINNGGTRLILDPGYVTTDWVVAQGYKMVNSRSGGRMGGVSNIYKNIASLIAKDHGHEQFSKIERIDQAFVSGKDFKYFGTSIDSQKFNHYLSKSSTVIEEIVSDIKARVGDTEDIDEILIAGGGANFFEPVVRKLFPFNPIQILKDPSFTNVTGFLIFAENVYASQQIEAEA